MTDLSLNSTGEGGKWPCHLMILQSLGLNNTNPKGSWCSLAFSSSEITPGGSGWLQQLHGGRKEGGSESNGIPSTPSSFHCGVDGLVWFLGWWSLVSRGLWGTVWHLLLNLGPFPHSLASLWSTYKLLGPLLTTNGLCVGSVRSIAVGLPIQPFLCSAAGLLLPGPPWLWLCVWLCQQAHDLLQVVLGEERLPQMFLGSSHTYLEISTMPPLTLEFILGGENRDM